LGTSLTNQKSIQEEIKSRLWSQGNSWFQAFAVFRMLFVFFWVIPQRLIYICLYIGIYKSDAGESPKRKPTTSQRKLAIIRCRIFCLPVCYPKI